MKKKFTERIGVCSWSLQPICAKDLIDKVLTLGINAIQIALDPVREGYAGPWKDLQKLCDQYHIKLVSGMLTTVGEDYSTLESIKRTGGIVPDHTWEENWKRIQQDLDWAEELNLPFVSFHAGFIPEDHSDPSYLKILDRVKRIADLFGEEGITLGLETGQEHVENLLNFLNDLERPNVRVNFDPANIILYDKGDPICAIHKLGRWIYQCHIKDAIRTKVPGTWGEEVVVGTGQVDWNGFLQTLNEIEFDGWMCIEREGGNQRLKDIQMAYNFIIQKAQELGL